MVKNVDSLKSYEINTQTSLIPSTVERIKEARGIAYSTFSGRPISLCRSLERRGELRVKFEEPIYISTVQLEDGFAKCTRDQPIVGVTKDISPHGVGFCYDEKIETDFVIAEFDLFGRGTEHLLIEIRWNEKNAPHSYVAGGLIIGVATEVH
ncbi:hypothetical protein [Thalassoglobus sp.]|uniref:hypothetical protein n=1 Tax=Thalassoglobus sp. TaxID=2795869 RepID=UPI003AA99A87